MGYFLKYLKSYIFFILFYFTAIILVSSDDNVIRITNGEWLPYHSEFLPYYGAGSRIVSEAFAMEGITVQWGFFPWARSYNLAVSGEWDASIGWIKTEEREKEVLFSDPVYGSIWVFYHLKEKPFSWESIEDLKGKKIGAIIGYNYGSLFEEAEKQDLITIEWVTKEEQNLMKLLNGRIDLFASAIDVAEATLNDAFSINEIEQITYHPKPFNTVNFHLVFTINNQNIEFVNLFNSGLARLRAEEIVKQYLDEARIQ